MEEETLYVIVSGSVQLIRSVRRGLEQDGLAILQAGDIFGSLSGLRMPFSAQVVSSNCEVLSAREKDLRLLPPLVVGQMRAQLSADTAQRLRKSCVFRGMGWDRQGDRQVQVAEVDLMGLSYRDLNMHLAAHLWQMK